MLNAGLSTLDYLKSRLLPEAGGEETQWDTALGHLGNAVAGMFQRHCNRRFERVTDAAEFYSARTLAVCLRCYPVEEITSLQLRDTDGTLTAAGVSYTLDEASGMLEFSAAPGPASAKLLVTYAGGYWLDDDYEELPEGATALPEEIREAWVAQCQALAAARALFGSVALSDPKTAKPSGELLPEVVEILRGYRRFAGE